MSRDNTNITSIPLSNELQNAGIQVRRGVSARDLTTMRVGGAIRELYLVPSVEALHTLLKHQSLVDTESPFLQALGAGSNSLFPDEEFVSPLVRLMGDFKSFSETEDGGTFRVGSAVGLMRFARVASEAGYAGLEFAGGIPATFGGAIRMNAGAHGGELGDLIESVRVILPDAEVHTFSRHQLEFHYRSCSLPAESIILDAVIKLAKSDRVRVQERLVKNLEYRKKTQPLSLPSFGSTFRNPLRSTEDDSGGQSAGELVELAGLKGERYGGAEISALHANWIVNPSRTATAKDIRSLMVQIQREVRERSGVDLEPEVIDWAARDVVPHGIRE